MKQKINRRDINRQRRALTEQQKRLAASKAKVHLQRLNPLLPKQAKVALYIDDFGELPTQPILDWCNKLGYKAYLPVVNTLGKQQKRMRFVRIKHRHLTAVPAVRHAFGMKEPKQRESLWAEALDVVFCPLVAADLQGNRMGMGGGFYDTTLSKSYLYGCKPLRIGWCYEFQVFEQLQTQPWDVPLDALITPQKIRWFL